jgi:hypothetical protein
MRIRKVFATLAFLFTMPLLAQSRWVFDSLNRQVGQLIGNEKPGLIRYELAPGDSVLLIAGSYALQHGASSISPVWFTGANCTGTAYVDPSSNNELTKRLAVVLNTSTANPTVLATSVLYVSTPFAPATLIASGTNALSKHANGTCTNGSFPIGGQYLVQVSAAQNLKTKFTPPFWTP